MMPRSQPQMLPQAPNPTWPPNQAQARPSAAAQTARTPGFIPVQPLPVPPAPTIRGQSAEEAKPAPVWPTPGVVAAVAAPPLPPAPLAIPAPEQLGLSPARPMEPVQLDWAAARTRLDQLGATCFHLEKLDNGWRFTCLLPTAEAGKQRRIDVEAATEAEAVQAALERAEKK